MTRHHGQDQPARVQPPDRPTVAPDSPPPPLGIFVDATGELTEDELRRIRDAFAAAQGQPAAVLYPVAPYERKLRFEAPRRSWWRRLLNLPPRRRDWV